LTEKFLLAWIVRVLEPVPIARLDVEVAVCDNPVSESSLTKATLDVPMTMGLSVQVCTKRRPAFTAPPATSTMVP